MKNKHLRLSIAIALVALSLSLLVLSSTDKRAVTSLQTPPESTHRLEKIAPGARR